MKIRTAIVAATLLLGGAATTFAGERRTDVRDRGDHRQVIVRHDDDRRDVRHDRNFHHDRDAVVREVPGCTFVYGR